MSWEIHQFVAVVNLAFCAGICWACMCRLNTNVCRWYLTARLRYTLLLGAAVASGLQPLLWNQWPSIADATFSGAVLAGLIINVLRWRNAGKEPT